MIAFNLTKWEQTPGWIWQGFLVNLCMQLLKRCFHSYALKGKLSKERKCTDDYYTPQCEILVQSEPQSSRSWRISAASEEVIGWFSNAGRCALVCRYLATRRRRRLACCCKSFLKFPRNCFVVRVSHARGSINHVANRVWTSGLNVTRFAWVANGAASGDGARGRAPLVLGVAPWRRRMTLMWGGSTQNDDAISARAALHLTASPVAPLHFLSAFASSFAHSATLALTEAFVAEFVKTRHRPPTGCAINTENSRFAW